MDRREALKQTTFLMGYALTASALASAVQSCAPDTSETQGEGAVSSDWTPEFFDAAQIALIAELAETLIPETDTPGAKSVEVHRFIDDEVKYMFTVQEQYDFVAGLEDVEGRAQSMYGKSFASAQIEERVEILKRQEADAEKAKENEQQIGKPFFQSLKELTFRGYFTSERVCKEVLKYDPIPGQYLGCIELEDAGKIWSL